MDIDYITRHIEWSATTFGPGKRTLGLTNHIRKELVEIESAPDDVEEWIDVIILALDGAWRAGASGDEILSTLLFKQYKNLKRQWPQNVAQDQPTEHID